MIGGAYAELDCVTGRYIGVLYRHAGDAVEWLVWLWSNPAVLWEHYGSGWVAMGGCLYA